MRSRKLLSFLVAMLAVGTPVVLRGQEPVRSLRDLLGARGSSGEQQIEARGYTYVKTEKSGGDSYTYWHEQRTNRCVAVRTSNGVYASIVYAPDSDCQGGGATQLPVASEQSDDSFDTVCGVEVGGKTHRYRCHYRAEGCKGQGVCKGHVTMPDNAYTVDWNAGGDKIEVTFEGMNPQKTTATFSDGQTRFELGGNTYFVYRSRDRAQKELANLH